GVTFPLPSATIFTPAAALAIDDDALAATVVLPEKEFPAGVAQFAPIWIFGVIVTVPVGEICQVSKSPAAGVKVCVVSLQEFAAAVIVQVSASAVEPS